MSPDFLTSLFSNAWSIVLIVLFFGGSIFVHELGHFLAARWRGVKVTRFSIGFGPKIFGWTGKDGVDYRLSWLPLGGYVALPQLADMSAIEGEDKKDAGAAPDGGTPAAEAGAAAPAVPLPPLTYSTRMIVFAAGATFNVLFAFLLATVIWIVGFPEANETKTTTIGIVYPTLVLADKSEVPSPASLAGLKPGDTIRTIDGRSVTDWNQVMEALFFGAGRTADGRRQTIFTIEREGKPMEIVLNPVLAGDDENRRVGISPIEDYDLIVGLVPAKSLSAELGFKVDDQILSLDGKSLRNLSAFLDHLQANKARAISAQVKRGEQTLAISIPPRPNAADAQDLGLQFSAGYHYIYPTPYAQVSEQVGRTFRTLSTLVNPKSDIGLNKLAGPIGIAHMYYNAAAAGIRIVIWLTILINISLAIFNLLPIPVLDGGHMMFATIGRLRGRPLPMNFIMTTQSVFMVLLFTMILYVSFFNVRTLKRAAEGNTSPPPVKTAPADPSGSQSAPSK